MRRMYSSAVAGLLAAGLGCGANDTTEPAPVGDPSALFWRLELNQHAVTLTTTAPTNTMQLVATSRNASGAPITGGGRVTFRVLANDTTLLVDTLGVLRVNTTNARTNIRVVATQTIDGVTLVDTALVNISRLTVPTPVFTTLSMQPASSDSAKTDVSRVRTVTLAAKVLNDLGVAIAGTRVYYWSSDTTIVKIDPTTGLLTPVRVGGATLYAQAYVYGVAKVDSLKYTIGESIFQPVLISDRLVLGNPDPETLFNPGTLTIAVGGVVNWLNTSSTRAIDIVFDDPSQVVGAIGFGTFGLGSPFTASCGTATGGGNIAPLARYDASIAFVTHCESVAARRFPVAGRYPYHSATYGGRGVIIVVP